MFHEVVNAILIDIKDVTRNMNLIFEQLSSANAVN